MKKIDVCLSPDLLHLYEVKNKCVVIVDILRATSCMVTGLAHGIKSIIPVATLEECKDYQCRGLIAAAERDGKKVEGFDVDNSPFSYMNEELKGKVVVMTTTNGTMALSKSKEAAEILIGAFLNISALTTYLKSQQNDILIVCAGWKGKVNAEDSLFAGAVVKSLRDSVALACDSPLIAESIYEIAKNDMFAYLRNSSHFNRLIKLNVEKDIEFCLKMDQYNLIPVLKGAELVRMQQ